MGIATVIQLLVLIALSLPVGFSLGYVVLYFFNSHGIPLTNLVQTMGMGLNSFPLLAIPFFILVGQLMNTGGMTKRIFDFANCIVGRIRGGLGHVNIFGSMIFAGMSGAAVADAAGLGNVEIKAMTESGYDLDYSVAITAASATIGPIIPPSIIMVVYGLTANVSVGRLFMGGIIPGIIMGLSMMALNYYYALKYNFPISSLPTLREFLGSFYRALPALVLPLIIVGGILGGVFTPTEAGGVAAVYALFLGLVVTRELRLQDLPKIFTDTMLQTAQVGFIIATAGAFSWVLTYQRLPVVVADYLVRIIDNPVVMLIALNAIYLFLGTIMEAGAIVIMTVPIVMPIITRLGIDPVHFGVLVAVNMAIGTLTPPVGTVMYILAEITGLSIERYTKAMIPWLTLLAGIILLLILFPPLITYIPSKLMP